MGDKLIESLGWGFLNFISGLLATIVSDWNVVLVDWVVS